MSIRFPDLGASRCFIFRACGYLETDDAAVQEALREARSDEWLRASTRAGSTSLIVLGAFGGSGSEPSSHLHIDVIRRDRLDKKLPGEAVPIASIRSGLATFMGEAVDVQFDAYFGIPGDQPPELVKATSFSTKVGDTLLATDYVSFAVDGPSPIQQIAWRPGQGEEIEVRVRARTKVELSESYLIDGFAHIKSAYNELVLWEEDGNTNT